MDRYRAGRGGRRMAGRSRYTGAGGAEEGEKNDWEEMHQGGKGGGEQGEE